MDIRVDCSIVDNRIKFFYLPGHYFYANRIHYRPAPPVLYGHTTY